MLPSLRSGADDTVSMPTSLLRQYADALVSMPTCYASSATGLELFLYFSMKASILLFERFFSFFSNCIASARLGFSVYHFITHGL